LNTTQSALAVLALDIGGTKIAAGVIRADGQLLSSSRDQNPASGTAEDLYQAVVQRCRIVLDEARVEIGSIGVGCGGPMEYPAGVVSPVNILVWRGFPLRARLIETFGKPCLVDNDAKALALGERWRGAGRGSDNMIGMVVSTGVGGGIILNGRLMDGFSGNAGHIGHVIVWPGGPLCGCGARGCVEGVSSGSGLTRRLDVALGEGAETSLRRGSTAADIAVAARAGDELACELYRTAGEGVGRGIASAAAVLDLERVVIGGSIALKAWDLLGPPLLAEVERSARLDFTRGLRVYQAELGDEAGLYGAAQLGLSTLA
jgi:glucokinase